MGEIYKRIEVHRKSGEYVGTLNITIDFDDGTDDLVLEDEEQ